MSGLYIHIPFCASRCIYCGFYSTTRDGLRNKYVDALCQEMRLRSGYLSTDKLDTIYIGGGTPSQLTADNLKQLFHSICDVYDISNVQEVTMECNPDDVTPEYAQMLSQLPINRASMGAQTFSNERLKFLHRRHNSDEVERAVTILNDVGINNVSIDLMFGFPGETFEDWISDINTAISLNVNHISAYSLMYEEGTPLYKMLKDGKIKEIDEELSLKMYDALIDNLTAAGYEHYEISNFARPGYRSRHNSSYWQAEPYIGIGAAAHSYDKLSRQWNVADIDSYISSVEKGDIEIERELLDNDTQYDDMITTALRTCEGINIDNMETSYRNFLIDNARTYINKHLMEIKDNRLRLTREGLYISDAIMSDLMKI